MIWAFIALHLCIKRRPYLVNRKRRRERYCWPLVGCDIRCIHEQHFQQISRRHLTPPPCWNIRKVTSSTNRKYITYRNDAKGGPSRGHGENAQSTEDRLLGSNDNVNRQTHRDTQTCSSQYSVPLPGGVLNCIRILQWGKISVRWSGHRAASN